MGIREGTGLRRSTFVNVAKRTLEKDERLRSIRSRALSVFVVSLRGREEDLVGIWPLTPYPPNYGVKRRGRPPYRQRTLRGTPDSGSAGVTCKRVTV